jgi:hypothetical protein
MDSLITNKTVNFPNQVSFTDFDYSDPQSTWFSRRYYYFNKHNISCPVDDCLLYNPRDSDDLSSKITRHICDLKINYIKFLAFSISFKQSLFSGIFLIYLLSLF